MPTIRYRKRHAHAPPCDKWLWILLTTGKIADPLVMFTDPREIEAAWAEHGPRITDDHARAHPGTRPVLWWRYSAPSQLRDRVGGVGVAQKHRRAWCGLPICEWTDVDRNDLPQFESEAAYLRRHNLLSADEKRRLRKSDFEPEAIPAPPYDDDSSLLLG